MYRVIERTGLLLVVTTLHGDRHAVPLQETWHVVEELRIGSVNGAGAATFGRIAALAAVGLYGTTSHTVTRRLPEMGIRIAIGARVGDIRRLVVIGALKVGLVGLGLGLLIAAGLGRLAGGLLLGVPPVHIPTFLTVASVLLLVSVLAALGPARKAGKSDPMNALRAE